MKKLLLAGLLSVGVACANETEKCTSETCFKFVQEYIRFDKMREKYNTDKSYDKLTYRQLEKMCESFMDLTPKDVEILNKKDIISLDSIAEGCSIFYNLD